MHPDLCKDKINYTVLPVPQDVFKKKMFPAFILSVIDPFFPLILDWFYALFD